MYTLEVKQDEEGELYIELPEDFLASVNWKVGDDIVWIDKEDGSWILQKKDDDDDTSNEA